MLFNSWLFIFFLAATFLLYYLPFFRKYQVNILILASIVFCIQIQSTLKLSVMLTFYEVFILLSVVFVNAILVLILMNKKLGLSRKRIVLLGIFSNIAILSFFKYKSFIASMFIDDLSGLGSKQLLIDVVSRLNNTSSLIDAVFKSGSTSSFILALPLPVGISFYTFHGISLIVDSMRRDKSGTDLEINAGWENNFRNICAYILFFPKLISGPIIKAKDFFCQIDEKKYENINWKSVMHSLIVGFFLKMVVADNLKDYTVWMNFPYCETLSSLTLITLIFGYSSQIFADFCGYSLIALGVAELFGYHLPVNFNFPYISKSFSEFWTRWHISLSKFLKDYLYIPLGGNKISQPRTYINLMVTMILGGLWHGAAWSYVLWGFFHGLVLVLERPFRNLKVSNIVINIIRIAVVYVFVSLAWLFFKLPDISHVILYFKAISNNLALPNNFGYIIPIIVFSIPVVGYHIIHLWNTSKGMMSRGVVDLFYAVMIFLIIFQHGSSNSFVYFQF